MLRENKTLRGLNLESNFFTGTEMQALVDELRDNDTLTEIKIDFVILNIFCEHSGFEKKQLWVYTAENNRGNQTRGA